MDIFHIHQGVKRDYVHMKGNFIASTNTFKNTNSISTHSNSPYAQEQHIATPCILLNTKPQYVTPHEHDKNKLKVTKELKALKEGTNVTSKFSNKLEFKSLQQTWTYKLQSNTKLWWNSRKKTRKWALWKITNRTQLWSWTLQMS